MPYIIEALREDLEHPLSMLKYEINKLSLSRDGQDAVDGMLNYVITSLLDTYDLRGHPRYKNINSAIGVLECVKLELYRRLAGPYEDRAIAKNGDIPMYML